MHLIGNKTNKHASVAEGQILISNKIIQILWSNFAWKIFGIIRLK